MSSLVESFPSPPCFVFLDRDGTLIAEKNYLSRLEDIEFLPGSEAAIGRLNRAGCVVVVISNQSGVGRGYFGEDFVRQCHHAMQAHLAAHGARVEAFYYCPHAPEDNCACRKPRTGMLEQAARDLALPLRGVMIGDRTSDLEAGHHAGLVTILVQTGYGRQTHAAGNYRADYVAADLVQAVDWILARLEQPRQTGGS